MAEYKCTNFDCQNHKKIVIRNEDSPRCGVCGSSLYEHKTSSWWKRNASKFFGIGALALILLVTVIKFSVIHPIPPVSCNLKDYAVETKPNWYRVIEIGAKCIKPIAIEFGEKLTPTKYDQFDERNVSPREEVSTPRVIEEVCGVINQFHEKYGKLPIYIIGSSGINQVAHRDKLVAELEKNFRQVIQLPIDFATADQKARHLHEGICADPDLPTKRHCEAVTIDIGSGNIKGGYIENCNPAVRNDSKERFVHFEANDFGTMAFSKKAQDIKSRQIDNFTSAAQEIRATLDTRIDTYVRTFPELTNGEKRYYLTGGACFGNEYIALFELSSIQSSFCHRRSRFIYCYSTN